MTTLNDSDKNTRTSLRREWQQVLARELDPDHGIPAVINKQKPLDGWDKVRSIPSSVVEVELECALQIAAADYDNPLTSVCTHRAAEVFRAGEEDPRWNTWWARVRHVERGRFISSGELAAAWVEDREPDFSKLRQAAADLILGSRSERPTWADLEQSEYLHGVELMLITGDFDNAQEHLDVRYSFKYVVRHHAWLSRIAQALSRSDYADIQDNFDPYFDRIRSPFFYDRADKQEESLYAVPALRLRLALLRWLYIERQPIAGNWRYIIEQIGY
jgi:hypothetical protein